MSPTRIALLISLLAIAAQRITAQQALDFAPAAVAQPPATPAEDSNQPVTILHVTSREVVLDVVVTDADGRPVKGLKPSNFALTEDGVPQSLAGFMEYSGSDDAAALAARSLPPNTFIVHAPIPEDTAKTIIVIGGLSPHWRIRDT